MSDGAEIVRLGGIGAGNGEDSEGEKDEGEEGEHDQDREDERGR